MWYKLYCRVFFFFFFFSSRRRHTRWPRDWSSDVCSSDLLLPKTLGVRDIDPHHPSCVSRQYQSLGRPDKMTRATQSISLRSEERRVGKECIVGRWGGQ